ncbi:MAG: TetR/AcrR family transcriptional regulator [Rhizomicrobium sp.]
MSDPAPLPPDGPQADGRLDPRIRRTRRDLRKALQDLLHAVPFDQITIRDIAAKAEVAYTTFFRHYPSKEALLADLAQDEAARLLNACWPQLRASDPYASCLALCRHVADNRAVWSALLCGGAESAVRTALIDETLGRAQDWPPALEWLPHDIGTKLTIGVIVDLLAWWLGQPEADPPERIAGILDKLLVSTLVRR